VEEGRRRPERDVEDVKGVENGEEVSPSPPD